MAILFRFAFSSCLLSRIAVDAKNQQQEVVNVSYADGTWGSSKFFVACPCQGRLGNKLGYFLSNLGIAKKLGRALILGSLGDMRWRIFSIFNICSSSCLVQLRLHPLKSSIVPCG
eukprot:TRINITY_DN105649_c0_g1_i1.p1 TRINITY_DN105649_c0_g1~~TRINITY_DN105649_c0_g1_i1.p1  ORF type:complete len:115 (-),score=9.96 TRINITY_DN105649_c0_g1_i1:108-452(-)